MPFLPPNQQHQSTEGTGHCVKVSNKLNIGLGSTITLDQIQVVFLQFSALTQIVLAMGWCEGFVWPDIHITLTPTKGTATITHTRLTALFQDYPGEPVPER